MNVIQYPANTSLYEVLRNSEDITGIVLIPTTKDIEQILQDVKGCPVSSSSPACFSAAHFAYDVSKNKLYQFVGAANTAYTFNQDGGCAVDDDSPLLPGADTDPNAHALSVFITSGRGKVVNQDCDSGAGLTAAELANLKCVLAEVLALGQAVTGGLVNDDIYVYNSTDFASGSGDRGTILGEDLEDVIAATCGITSEAAIANEAALRVAELEAEVVAATNVITESENGKTFFLNHATEFVSTLPLPFLGGNFRFIVANAPETDSFTVVTKNSANILIGHVLTSQDAGGTADSETAGGDTLTFVLAKAVVGDMAEFWSDGVNWFVEASGKVFDAITITTAS